MTKYHNNDKQFQGSPKKRALVLKLREQRRDMKLLRERDRILSKPPRMRLYYGGDPDS